MRLAYQGLRQPDQAAVDSRLDAEQTHTDERPNIP
jgi:hypothetical protein